MSDAINDILDYACRIKFEDIPASVIGITKDFLLDTGALIAAGSNAPGCAEVLDQLVDWGGKPESRLFVRGGRLPAPYAAMANSVMAHALDFDDTHERGDMHGYAVVLPATLAIADRVGKVSGKDFLAAIVVGIDVAYRLGLGIKTYRGWHPTATCGVFGAAIAAGKLAGLDRTQMHNAMGIAFSLSSGNFQCILDGSLTKRLQPAFAARAAVEAVMLAARGITGAKQVLEGKFGFYPLYEANEYNRAPLTERLGEWFEGQAASMKPYPSCRFCHAGIDAVIELVTEHDLKASDIASMRVEMPEEAHDYVGGPYKPGDSPQVSAQFNAAYNVAVAATRRKVGLAEIEIQSVLDPALRELAGRVETVATHEKYCFGPQDITITLRNGTSLSKHVDVMTGHPDRPLTRAQLMAKVRDCVAYGGAPASDVDRLVVWAAELDTAPDALTGLPEFKARSAAA